MGKSRGSVPIMQLVSFWLKDPPVRHLDLYSAALFKQSRSWGQVSLLRRSGYHNVQGSG